MSRDQGTIVDLEDEYAIVLFRREEDGPCAACPGDDLCSTLPPEECERKVRALNKVGAEVGARVGVRLPDDGQLGAALLQAFGLPFLAAMGGLVGGSLLGTGLGLQGTAVSLAGAGGLVVALVAWIPAGRFLDRIRAGSRMFVPVVEPYRPELEAG